MRAFADRFQLQDFNTHVNVNDKWIEFKTIFLKAVDKFISSKRQIGYPWIDARIRTLIMEKENLFHQACTCRFNADSLKSRYKRLRNSVQKEMCDAYWRYI